MTIVKNIFIFINTNMSCDHGSLAERKKPIDTPKLDDLQSSNSKHDVVYW
jgi:hypothetical protein